MNYFEAEKVTERITRIKTVFEVCAYLVIGEESAVLLDTGMGVGDLKGFVESICPLPYKVILSHGHCDHAGGSGQFNEVYLSSLDYELEKHHCNLEFRIEDLHHGPFEIPEYWTKEHMIPQRTAPFKDLTEDMSFDLGAVTISPILVPGHTKGMMIFIIPEEEVAIFGDASGENTLICFPESTSVAKYLDALKRLKQMDLNYTRILRNHGTYESAIHLLDNNITTCEKILAKTDDRVPVHIHGVDGFAGKDRNKLTCEEEKVGNVVYT